MSVSHKQVHQAFLESRIFTFDEHATRIGRHFDGMRFAKDPDMASREPAEVAHALETAGTLPEGNEERFVGYGVMAAPFSSGDLLAMRRFPVSSLGGGYTTVWHRAPDGLWTIYSDREPQLTCPRYFGRAESGRRNTNCAVVARPEADGNQRAGCAAVVDLRQTRTTRFMNAAGRMMSDRMWRSQKVLAVLSRMAAAFLHTGRLGLTGRSPNGQAFVANPMTVWLIRSSHARIAGRDLGPLAPLVNQARLGDFWIPQRALFAFGRAFFEPLDVTRHEVEVSRQQAPPLEGRVSA